MKKTHCELDGAFLFPETQLVVVDVVAGAKIHQIEALERHQALTRDLHQFAAVAGHVISVDALQLEIVAEGLRELDPKIQHRFV